MSLSLARVPPESQMTPPLATILDDTFSALPYADLRSKSCKFARWFSLNLRATDLLEIHSGQHPILIGRLRAFWREIVQSARLSDNPFSERANSRRSGSSGRCRSEREHLLFHRGIAASQAKPKKE